MYTTRGFNSKCVFWGVFIISNAGNLLSFIFLFSAYFQALKETCCTVLQCVASCDLTHFYSTCLKDQLTPKSLEIFRIQVISITSTMQKGEHMPGCRPPLQTLCLTHRMLSHYNGLSHHHCRNQHCTSVSIVFCPLQHPRPFVPQDKGNSHMFEL